MPVPTNLSDLSTTAGNNSPAATDTISTTDDYLRAHASILAKISDGTNALVTPALGAATATSINGTTIPTSDTLVTLTGSQTLTNKTLTSPALNGTVTTTGLTLPAFTLGGAITGNSQNITGLGTLGCGAINATGLVDMNRAGNPAIGFRNANAYEGYIEGVTGGGLKIQVAPGLTTSYTFGNTALTTSAAVTSLAFQAGNPSLNIGTGALTAGTGTFSGATTHNAGALFTTTYDAGKVAGGITKHSVIGLNLNAITGSVFDYSVYSADGTALIYNPTGTHNVVLSNGVATISSTGLAVTGAVSATGGFTANGFTAPSGTTGIEVGYSTGSAYAFVQGYERNSASYKELQLDGSVVKLNISGVTKATLDASGNLLVGETTNNSFSARLALSYDSGTTSWAVGPWVSQPTKFYISANSTTNGVYLNGTTATSWSALSDARFKTDLEDITDALSKVLTLSAVTGCYVGSEVRHPFLIAQEVQAVLPEAVDTSDPNKLGLSYTDTIPLLVAAIKELSAKNDALEARIAALEAK